MSTASSRDAESVEAGSKRLLRGRGGSRAQRVAHGGKSSRRRRRNAHARRPNQCWHRPKPSRSRPQSPDPMTRRAAETRHLMLVTPDRGLPRRQAATEASSFGRDKKLVYQKTRSSLSNNAAYSCSGDSLLAVTEKHDRNQVSYKRGLVRRR